MKAQANAPTILGSQAVMQQITAEVVKAPTKGEEKRGDIRVPPSRNCPPNPKKTLCCSQNLYYPQLV